MINFKQNTIEETVANIKQMLRDDVYAVTFTKVDGSQRVMRCTLRPDLLPPTPVTEGHNRATRSVEVIPVWDVESGGWRSFKVSSVLSIDKI